MEVEGRVLTFWLAMPGNFLSIITTFCTESNAFMQHNESFVNANYCLLIQVCGSSDSQELPPNFIQLAKDAYTPDLIAASDCMLGMHENFCV